MQLRHIAACLSLAIVAACAAVPAVASATNHPVVVENGTPVAAGTKFKATNVGVIKTTTNLGTIECTTAILTGEWTKNTTGTVEGDITSAVEGGTGATQAGAPHPECTTASFLGGDTTVTLNPATNGLPWCIRSTEEMKTDEFQIRGNSCPNAARPIRIVKDITNIGTCVYERNTPIPGTFTTSDTDSVLTISEVEIWPVAGNPFACPGHFRMDMSLTLETDVSPFTSLGITP